jgi:hypothetical protein
MTSPPLPTRTRLRRLVSTAASYGWWELVVIAVLYLGYSATRLVASDAVGPAVDRAGTILRLEQWTGFAWEHGLNGLFRTHEWLGVAASYQYATAHYLVTAFTLVLLYRRGGALYRPARRALAGATAVALLVYVALPVAPPRLTGQGYTDVLALNQAAGWWGGDASAPQGLGDLTNELAALPSMHAGWALWVALVVWAWTRNRVVRVLAAGHALVTAVVVVGTGNHWVYDVLAGWLVVLAAWALASRTAAPADAGPLERRAAYSGSPSMR